MQLIPKQWRGLLFKEGGTGGKKFIIQKGKTGKLKRGNKEETVPPEWKGDAGRRKKKL